MLQLVLRVERESEGEEGGSDTPPPPPWPVIFLETMLAIDSWRPEARIGATVDQVGVAPLSLLMDSL